MKQSLPFSNFVGSVYLYFGKDPVFQMISGLQKWKSQTRFLKIRMQFVEAQLLPDSCNNPAF